MLVSHKPLMILFFSLALLVQGCAPWQPPFPATALLGARCGQTTPCSPCADAPGLGHCPTGCACKVLYRVYGGVFPAATPPPLKAEAPAREGDWDCNSSAFEGDQIWTCHEGLLYRCEGGEVVTINCARGCESMELGEDDTCSP